MARTKCVLGEIESTIKVGSNVINKAWPPFPTTIPKGYHEHVFGYFLSSSHISIPLTAFPPLGHNQECANPDRTNKEKKATL